MKDKTNRIKSKSRQWWRNWRAVLFFLCLFFRYHISWHRRHRAGGRDRTFTCLINNNHMHRTTTPSPAFIPILNLYGLQWWKYGLHSNMKKKILILKVVQWFTSKIYWKISMKHQHLKFHIVQVEEYPIFSHLLHLHRPKWLMDIFFDSSSKGIPLFYKKTVLIEILIFLVQFLNFLDKLLELM